MINNFGEMYIKFKCYICAEKQMMIHLLYLTGIINDDTAETMCKRNVMNLINKDLKRYCELKNLDIEKVLESYKNC